MTRIGSRSHRPPVVFLLSLRCCRVGQRAGSCCGARRLIHGLRMNDENIVTIASAGGNQPLIALLSSHSAGVQRDAAAAMANLSAITEIGFRVQLSLAGLPFPLDRAAVVTIYECSGDGDGCVHCQ